MTKVKIEDLQEGTRVRLAELWDEGELLAPEQSGVVSAIEDQNDYPGMLIVDLDEEFLQDDYDDGIRELHVDQVLRVLPEEE